MINIDQLWLREIYAMHKMVTLLKRTIAVCFFILRPDIGFAKQNLLIGFSLDSFFITEIYFSIQFHYQVSSAYLIEMS